VASGSVDVVRVSGADARMRQVRPQSHRAYYSQFLRRSTASLQYSNVYGYSSSHCNAATPLRELTCHMGSHSVTCHPTEVTFPPLPQPKLVLDLATPEFSSPTYFRKIAYKPQHRRGVWGVEAFLLILDKIFQFELNFRQYHRRRNRSGRSLSPYSHTYYYWYSITHSLFHSRLKSFLFYTSSLPQPFLFLLQDSLYGFPTLFTVTSEHIRLFTF